MQVAIHAGVHRSDEGRLLACLRDNAEALRACGTKVPEPESYHRKLRDLIQTAQQTTLPPDTRAAMAEVTGTNDHTARLVLDNPGFFGTPKMAVGEARFYPSADIRLACFQQIFAPDGIELFLGLRNPAALLPALVPDTPFSSVSDLLRGADPLGLRWSEMIGRLRSALPDIPVTVWCNEDTPLIWTRLLRAMAGIDETVPLRGEFALLPEILTETGLARFNAFVESRTGLGDTQKERLVAAYLDKVADPAAVEEEIDVPDWDGGTVAQLSALYDTDMAEIAEMEGVRMIRP